jgi:hypothetical protein
MQAGQYSRTALAAAFYQAQHHLHDEHAATVSTAAEHPAAPRRVGSAA